MSVYSRDLFNVSGCDISSIPLSDVEKDMVQSVIDGSAFTNPIESAMGEVQGQIGGVLAEINAAGPGISFTNPETGEATTTFDFLSSKLGDLNSGIDDYRVHSVRLSGVSISKTIGSDSPYGFGGIQGEYPGLAGLQQVAQTYNTLKETFRDPAQAAQDNYSPIFNSLFGPGNDLIRSGQSLVEGDVANFMTNFPTGSEPGVGGELAALGAQISELQSNVTNLINDDNLQYEFAVDFIAKNTVGLSVLQMLDDPCFGTRLLEKIGSSNLKETAGI